MKIIKIILVFSFFHLHAFSQSSAEEYYINASVQFEKGNFIKSIELLDKAIFTDNTDERFFFLRAECFYNMIQYNEAADNFKTAYKLKNKFALYKIAECYSYLDLVTKSTEYLKLYLKTKDKLLRSDIRTNKAFTNIENSKEWIILWKEEHYNNYEKKLDEAKYSINKNDYANAFEILDKLLIKSNKRYRALEMRGDLLYLTGDYKSAAKDYINASKIKSRNITYKIKSADALFKNKKIKKSIEIYNLIIEKEPAEIDILLKKAEAELKVSDYNNAQNSISNYLKYDQSDPEALNIAGKVYYYKKDYINALISFNQCLKFDQTKSEYFVNRGDAYTAVRMYENAVYDYSMALDLDPKQAEVYYKRGIANLNINNDESCNDFQEALNLNYHRANDYIIKYCK